MVWIGGPPCAGKTTVASRLARRHGLRLYSSDTMTWAHRDRAIAAGHAAAIRWEALTPEQRRTVSEEDLLAMSLHAERGQMVLDDLAALPECPAVIAEGTVLPARAVRTGTIARERVLWLIPAAGFQSRSLAMKGVADDRLTAALSRQIAAEAAGLPSLEVGAGGAESSLEPDAIETTTAAVERRLGPALRAGPHARDGAERSALIRAANLAIVEQVRAGSRRHWATIDPDSARRRFACECGRADCAADLELAVSTAAAGAVRAHPI